VLRFAVPPTEASTAGLDREFASFCAEPLASVVAGKTYRFEARRPDDPEGFGLPDTADGRKEAERRAGYVRELFGRHYPAAVRGADPVPAAAFQVALWELTQEADPPAAGRPFSLTSGAFRSRDGGPEEAAVAAAAEEMLQSLTGSDAVFYEADGTRGAELVRLRGVANLAGEVAQAQFTLRSAGGFGGTAGGGGVAPNSIALAPALGTGLGGGAGGLGGPTGFLSPGFGNGGSGSGGSGSGGGGSSPSGTTGTTSAGGNNSNTPPVLTNNGSTSTTSTISTTNSTNSTTSTTSTTNSTNSTTSTTSTTDTTNATTSTTSTTSTTDTTTTNGTPGTDNTSIGRTGSDNIGTDNTCVNCSPDLRSTTNGTNTPVPAPPAVVLGLIAVGFFAARRTFSRGVKA
jgi:hypothetical protein